MPRKDKIVLSFNAGELSELVGSRIDQGKYESGCRKMENYLPMIQGGAERRPGTYFANETKDSSVKSKIVPFEFNVEQAYALEFGNRYIRVYKGRNSDAEAGLLVGGLLGENPAWTDATDYINGDIIEYSSVIYRCIWSHTSATGAGDGSGGEPDTNTTEWIVAALTADNYPIYEIVTPYLTADLFQLKFERSNDVVWITHPDYEPRRLSRISLCSWTLIEESYEDGPFLDRNTDTDKTITASAVTGTVTLTATGHEPFVTGTTAGHSPSGTSPTSKSLTGTLFQLVHAKEAQSVTEIFTFSGELSDTLEVPKGVTWDFTTSGSWRGEVFLERSYDDWITTEYIHSVISQSSANAKIEGTEEFDGAVYRMRAGDGPFDSWRKEAYAQLSIRNSDHIGVVEITSVASSTSATGTVVRELGSTDQTYRWSEGYWSNLRGWPSCVAISPEERLTFAGSTTYPLTVWGSKADNYESMDVGTGLDDEAVIFTLTGSGRQNSIIWMLSRNSLHIGTVGGEHILGASSEKEAMTPTNVKAAIQSSYGSANLQSLMINDAILFVQKGGRKIREMIYSFQEDSLVADDLNVFASHITESGIVDWDYQRTPDPFVWCVREDGELALMAYDRKQNVWAWVPVTTHDNTSQSSFESVAVISTPFEEDQVWCIVKRTIGGVTKRFVENFSTRGF